MKPRTARFQPSHDLIPADLLPVHSEILAFWATKAGAKTERAWSSLLTELRKIHRDPQGGTDALRGQLQTGIDRAPIKPWLSVTWDNWRQFGIKTQATATTASRRMSQTEAGAAAVAFYHAREARKAAAAAAQQPMQQALLVEVLP